MSHRLLWYVSPFECEEVGELDSQVARLTSELAALHAGFGFRRNLDSWVAWLDWCLEDTLQEMDARHITVREWAAVTRPDLSRVGARVSALSEIDFLSWLSGQPEETVLGRSGVEDGVIHHHVCRVLDLPLAAILPETSYVVLSDGDTSLRAPLPGWAVRVNQLTSRSSYARRNQFITAKALRWLLRLPRTRRVKEVLRHVV